MSSLNSYVPLNNTATTTNATPFTVINYTLEPDSVTHATCRILGRKQSNGHAFAATFVAVLRRVGSGSGGSTIVLAPVSLITPLRDGLDMLTTDYFLWLNTDNLTLDVQGLAGTSIDWFVDIQLMVN